MQIVKEIYDAVVARDPEQPEFHQAVWEVLESLGPALERHPEYIDMVKRVVEPERLIHFRVPWVDEKLRWPYLREWRTMERHRKVRDGHSDTETE